MLKPYGLKAGLMPGLWPLSTMIDGYVLHRYESLGSTNSEAMRIAEMGGADGTVVLADTQTAGRGRYGKSWISLPNNLQFSILSHVKGANVSQLALIAAIAVSDALDEVSPKKLKINHKWPNDVLIDDKKVAGILLESKINQSSGSLVVVGIGLNVSLSPPGCVSLADCWPVTVELRMMLLNSIIGKYDALKKLWLNYGFVKIRELWLKRAWRVGETFVINTLNSQLIGKFIDLSFDGDAVFVRDAKKIIVSCGEIFAV